MILNGIVVDMNTYSCIWDIRTKKPSCDWVPRINKQILLKKRFQLLWFDAFESSRSTQRWQYCHFCIAYIGKSKVISIKKHLQWGLNLGLWDLFRTFLCLPNWANLALLMTVKLLRSLHSYALLIIAKSSKSKSQLVYQQKWS